MKHPISEQIKAIQTAREIIKKTADLFDLHNPELDEKLNDAGSTLAAINLANIKFDAAISGFASPEELTAKP